MMRRDTILFVLFTLFTVTVYSQANLCEISDPFCTSDIYTFPASTGGEAQSGPDYGCLSTQPNPAWYHMKIADAGNIDIEMSSDPPKDIDFICWGPFTDPFSPCTALLVEDAIIDCSYDGGTGAETCNIPNGQTGEYYILLITNYSDDPCDITFQKVGGTGETDCGIVPPPVSNNGPLCVHDDLELYAEYVNNATYSWTGPDSFTSNQQNPIISDVGIENAGVYELVITVNGVESSPVETTVVINDNPIVSAGDDITIPYGTTTQLNGTASGGSESFSFDWQPSDKLIDNTIEDPLTINLIETTTFLMLAEDNNSGCTSSDDVIVTIDGESMLLDITTDNNSLCTGNSATIEAVATQGSGSYTYAWTSDPPGTNLATRIITATPVVTTTYFVEVTDGFTTLNDEITITVVESPIVNAGDDITIPSGWPTDLEGDVNGGSGNYNLLWEPQDLLENPTVLNPITVPLYETVIFTLYVTDADYGCGSSDDMTVFVTGGELTTIATANPTTICVGEIVNLNAQPSGGSGDYEYSWTSTPAGFTSTEKEPTDYPEVTTTYYVSVFDGQNTVEASVTVIVNPIPIVNAGDDITITIGATTELEGDISGGSGNYEILWQPENLLENPSIINPTTVELWANQVFTLNVTDSDFGCTSSDNMTVIVSGYELQIIALAEPMIICSGETVQLNAVPSGGSGDYEYSWTSVPAGFVSDLKEPTDNPEVTTTYTVSVFDGQNTIETSVTVVVNPIPIVNAGDNQTIANGWTTQLDGDVSGGSGSYDILWQPENLLENPTVLNPLTIQLWATEEFTLNIIDSEGCTNSDNMTVVVTGGELQVTATADPSIICQNDIVNLNALPSGGSGNNTYTWTSDPPGFNATISNPSHHPQVTTTYTVSVFDGQNTAESSITVKVNPVPISDAGDNITINIGTSTVINQSSAQGGTGELSYYWTPEEALINPNVLHPETNILYESTEFEFTVIDVSGCSSITDNMFVLLDGDELSVFPTSSAIDNIICQGETTTLFPNALGGGGNYTYLWLNGETILSDTESINVSPLETTTYTIEVNNTYTTITDSITIFVNHTPVINLIPNDVTVIGIDTITVCVRDTVRLDAGGDPLNPPEMNYLWSTAATSQYIYGSTNGNWVDVESYDVSVQNPTTLCYAEASITVIFDFQECNIGVNENTNLSNNIFLTPNPTKNNVQLKTIGLSEKIDLSLLNIQGEILWKETNITPSYETFSKTITLEHLNKGIYILRLSHSEDIYNIKIIKQ